jgi:hypothetical protein
MTAMIAVAAIVATVTVDAIATATVDNAKSANQ